MPEETKDPSHANDASNNETPIPIPSVVQVIVYTSFFMIERVRDYYVPVARH
jgi:hypothetical protein